MASAEATLQIIGRAFWNATPTVTDESQQQLAMGLGYPQDWRVVRRIEPIEEEVNDDDEESNNDNDDDNCSNGGRKRKRESEQQTVIVDRIYAGKPPPSGDHSNSVDVWFNHFDAQQAAVELMSDENNSKSLSGYEFKGGHLFPRVAKYSKGDTVQVLYDDDNEWYDADIVKRKDSNREGFKYTVYYPFDDTTQDSVLEEDIREPLAIATSIENDPYQAAIDLGFPCNVEWQAIKNVKAKKWKFIAPNGKIFTTKKAALTFANKTNKAMSAKKSKGGSKSKNKKTIQRGRSKKTKGITKSKNTEEEYIIPEEETEKVTTARKMSIYEENLYQGDPPWRTSGHEYIGRRIIWNTIIQKSVTRKVSVEQQGIVRGWISKTDTDSNGESAFVSEQTNEPANLFYVIFDEAPNHPYSPSLLATQDLEEFEVAEAIVD